MLCDEPIEVRARRLDREDLHDPDETATFTRLRIVVGNAIVTRNYSRRGGGESTAVNVPLLPLAAYLARNWWSLLNEPLRRCGDEPFQARHRLDVAMHGYAFPALGIWSGGDAAVSVDWTVAEEIYSPVDFRAPAPPEPVQIERETIEADLMDLVEAALARVGFVSAARRKAAA